VHSYHAVPRNADVIAATSVHGVRFVAAVARDNVFAVQFHPEKSQRTGLRLLAKWLSG
jgi:glutamine amidotransferase